MTNETQKHEVTRIIDDLQNEIVRTVSELVGIHSVNPGYPGV